MTAGNVRNNKIANETPSDRQVRDENRRVIAELREKIQDLEDQSTNVS